MYPRFLTVFMFASVVVLAIVVHGAKLGKREESTTIQTSIQKVTTSCSHKHHAKMNCSEHMKKSLNAKSSSAKLIELASFMKPERIYTTSKPSAKPKQSKAKRDVISREHLAHQDHEQQSPKSHQHKHHQHQQKNATVDIGQVLRATISLNETSSEPIDLNITISTTTTEAPLVLPSYNLSQIL